MISIFLITITFIIISFFKSHRKSSPFLSRFNDMSVNSFTHVNKAEVETLKKYIRVLLFVLGADALVTPKMIGPYININQYLFYSAGCVLLLLFMFFFISKAFFDKVKSDLSSIGTKTLGWAIFLLICSYTVHTIPPTQLNASTYPGLSLSATNSLLIVVFRIFFYSGGVMVGLTILCFVVVGVVAANYHVSNLVCQGFSKFAGFCLRNNPDEPHSVLAYWFKTIAYVSGAIVSFHIVSKLVA